LVIDAPPDSKCRHPYRFLFETLEPGSQNVARRILYTGDFRFDNLPLASLSALHSSTSLQPITLDEMYLDTTFCHKEFPSFPKRDEAMRRIWYIYSFSSFSISILYEVEEFALIL
jgi:hypothetical protein